MRADRKLLFNRLDGTVVYVTHDQAEAMTLSDRVVVMKDGIVQQVGAPLALYDRPTNIFVAGFLGSPTMNFVNCALVRDGERLRLYTGDVRWPFSLPPTADLTALKGESVVLGVRPEDITVAPMGQLAAASYVPCTVEVVEHMGSINIIYISVAGTRLIATMETAFEARSGDMACIAINPNKVHLFNPETSKRLD